MIKSTLKICFLYLLASSCTDGNNCECSKITDENTRNLGLSKKYKELDSLKGKVITGDTNAYDLLMGYGDEYPEFKMDGMFFWSLIMANLHDDTETHYSVFNFGIAFFLQYGLEFDDLDKETQLLLLKHLKIAKDRGVKLAEINYNSFIKDGIISETGELLDKKKFEEDDVEIP